LFTTSEAALDAAQERGETQKRALEAVLQALPVGVIVTDAQGGVVRANRCGEAIWGSRPATREVADYAQYRAWWADSGRPVAPEEWASAQVVREGVPVIGQILKIELRKERLDLAEIIAAALEMSHSEVGRGDRRLTVSVPREPLAVEGDRVRMVQVVSNLLNNAAKFTDEGAHIRLDVVPQGDRVEIRVQDDGRGIPRERLSDVFELFAQAEPGHAGGLGIGLSLVRSLVAMHNGTISAHSEGPGHGAAFTVSLPLCRGVSAQPRPSDARKTDSAVGRRVLVVDDNRDIAEGMRLLLRTLKVEVRVAHNGAEAIRICEEWSPTHVLMDLGMPGMDGYEAARRLCARHPDRTFRLVAISGWGQDEHQQLAREAGFDQHLTKPVKLVDLETVLSP
jgi:CheY-like chemotaxis protein